MRHVCPVSPTGIPWGLGSAFVRCFVRLKTGLRVDFPLTALALFGFPTSGYAATINAASCSQSAVASAASSANRNDTVTVPAGACSWNSPVLLTKGITLVGAGVGSTVITSSGSLVLVSAVPDATAIANGENIKITGFTFNGAGAASILINIQGANGISGTKPYRYIIIGDNEFQNTNPSSSTLVGAVIQSNATRTIRFAA